MLSKAPCFAAADVYDDLVSRVSPLGLETECVGGGRILHKPGDKSIEVYGYSQVCMLVGGEWISGLGNTL